MNLWWGLGTFFKHWLLLRLLGLLQSFWQEEFTKSLTAKRRNLLTVSRNLGREDHWFQSRRHRNGLENFVNIFIRQWTFTSSSTCSVFEILHRDERYTFCLCDNYNNSALPSSVCTSAYLAVASQLDVDRHWIYWYLAVAHQHYLSNFSNASQAPHYIKVQTN